MITTTAPYLFASLACFLTIILGLMELKPQVAGIVPTPSTWDLRQRFTIGLTASALIDAIILLLAFANGVTGTARILVLTLAFAVLLYCGFVVPRKPLVAANKRRRALRTLLPSLINFTRVALSGRATALEIMQRYAQRTDDQTKPMRELLLAALSIMDQEHLRPFAALAHQARATGCRELIDLCDSLAQAESDGSPIEQILVQQQATLEAILHDEFKRLVTRRTLMLVAASALSVLFGVFLNILWIMAGSALLQQGIGV